MSSFPKRILVTGGAGFIGSHLVNRLIMLGHRVTVLDDLSTGCQENVPPQAELVIGCVTNDVLVQHHIERTEACFHLVNQSSLVTLLYFIAQRSIKIPIVYASSAAVYGNPKLFPIAETEPLLPLSAYGVDKLGCELQAAEFGLTKEIPSFGLRLFNVFGPRQRDDSGLIPRFVRQIRNRGELTIYGDGKQTRDFVHVEDVVNHMLAAVTRTSAKAPVCNVGTGIETSILDLTNILGNILGYKPSIVFKAARTGDIVRSVADTKKAKEVLHCEVHLMLEDALKFLYSS